MWEGRARPHRTKGTYNEPPMLSKTACRALYITTAINPALSICANQYTGLCFRHRSNKLPGSSAPAVDSLYRALFYFARLKCAAPLPRERNDT